MKKNMTVIHDTHGIGWISWIDENIYVIFAKDVKYLFNGENYMKYGEFGSYDMSLAETIVKENELTILSDTYDTPLNLCKTRPKDSEYNYIRYRNLYLKKFLQENNIEYDEV